MIDLFTELAEAGKKVIMITVSSVLSGTYQTACLVARQVMSDIKGSDIRIVDSKTSLLVLSAVLLWKC